MRNSGGCAVLQTAFNYAGAHIAVSIQPFSAFAGTTLTEDLFGWQPESEVGVPAIAEDLAVLRVGLNIWLISQA
jgi:hypothetical protein